MDAYTSWLDATGSCVSPPFAVNTPAIHLRFIADELDADSARLTILGYDRYTDKDFALLVGTPLEAPGMQQFSVGAVDPGRNAVRVSLPRLMKLKVDVEGGNERAIIRVTVRHRPWP